MADSAAISPPAWRKRLYLPAYLVREAAALAGVHPTTVARWHYGYLSSQRKRTKPVLSSRVKGLPLSYLQLVEVSFVASFRRLGFQIKQIRAAHDYLSQVFGAEYPFAEYDL